MRRGAIIFVVVVVVAVIARTRRRGGVLVVAVRNKRRGCHGEPRQKGGNALVGCTDYVGGDIFEQVVRSK